MSEDVTGSREEQLKELEGFTEMVDGEIANITGILGWTVESVTNVDKEYFTCPYDSSHQLTEESLNDHLSSCQWKAEGYGITDIPLSEPSSSVDSPFSIKIDEQLQDKILRMARELNPEMQTGMGERLIPRTSDRLLTDFTSDERRALYNYVIANTAKPDIGHDIADINDLKRDGREARQLSFIELLIQERNLKRRRAKHRGVHTNKKSHVEILREVINQQMEIFTDYVSEQNSSKQVIPDRNAKTDDTNYEATQDTTDNLYKVSHSSSRNCDSINSRDNSEHYYSKRDNSKTEYSKEKDYRRSRDRHKRERYSDEYDERRKKRKHSRHRSSHSRDRKSHKKNKHRSKERHKDKRKQKKHKSQDRDRSSERNHSKHK